MRWIRTILPLTALCLAAVPVRAQNPTMEDDFARIMEWLTHGTAQGLAFNSGSTFDPPNEMRPWRIQPDVSFGVGVMPFDKSTFPTMEIDALAEKNPKNDLPDSISFPNLTIHSRVGLPMRMDLGLRAVNMTVPKNYKLSPNTVGNGQSNTLGLSLRKHFFGNGSPLLTVSGAYNRVSGYFNFRSTLKDVELVKGVFKADSVNQGQLDWNVTSIGVNFVVSQAFGKWTPFFGAGVNKVSGIVDGRLEAVWDTPLIDSTVGKASSRPESHNTRLILGFQRDGSFFKYFMNSEVKTSGFASGQAFIVSTGLAAPFRIGANSHVVRYGRNKPKGYDASKERPLFSEFTSRFGKRGNEKRKKREKKKEKKKTDTHRNSFLERYWNWGKKKNVKKSRSEIFEEKAVSERPSPRRGSIFGNRSRSTEPELIFIR